MDGLLLLTCPVKSVPPPLLEPAPTLPMEPEVASGRPQPAAEAGEQQYQQDKARNGSQVHWRSIVA